MEENKNTNKNIKNITINDKDVINEMLTIADRKAKKFFDIIYSKSSSSICTSSSQENVNKIMGIDVNNEDDDDDDENKINHYKYYLMMRDDQKLFIVLYLVYK